MATFSDTITESVAERLMKDGVAMLAGIDDGLAGIQAAVDVGAAWSQPPSPPLLSSFGQHQDKHIKVLDEVESKSLLSRNGIPVPEGRVVHCAEEAVDMAKELGFPVVVKALGLAHKTDFGGVRLNLNSPDEVATAVMEMSGLSESYLVEKMVDGVVAELIVGVARDEQFGSYLLVGGGGILVEMMKDSASLLMPTTRERVLHALGQLMCAPLLSGFRGAPLADLNAAADIILAVAGMVENDTSSIIELDINPLMVLAEGQGVVAADALISLNVKPTGDNAKLPSR
jgi:acetyl-CoA synthetase